MRGEWAANSTTSSSNSSVLASSPQGLTRQQMRSPLALASMYKRLKDRANWEVSERRQVGDAESMVNDESGGKGAWWRNVTMEEGL